MDTNLPEQPVVLISNPPPITPPIPPAKPKIPIAKILIIIFILLFIVVASAGFLAGYMQKSILNTYAPSPSPQEQQLNTPQPSPTPTPESSTPLPSNQPNTETQSKTITSTTNLDGYESSNGSGNTTVDIRAGRNTFAVTRGFVSFDLTSLPANSQIESASLRLYQTHVTGSPYSIGGSLKIDHMEFGDVLDGNDYPLAPLQTNLATLTVNSDVEWKEVVVTEALKEDIKNSRTKSQFRLSFTTEAIGGESGGDFAYFESGENFVGTGNIPQLVVRYRN